MQANKNPAPAATGDGAMHELKTPQQYTDPVREFQHAMERAGIPAPAAIVADGRLHRFHIEGHRRGSLNGAYVLHLDGRAAGFFEDFKAGIRGTWTAGGGRAARMDERTRRAIEDDRKRRAAEMEERHRKAAHQARATWHQAEPCTCHPYLTRKAVAAYEGVRVGTWRKRIEGPDGWQALTIPGALLVPMIDEAGAVWNLQAIFAEPCPELGRDKDFGAGRKAGLFFPIGDDTETLRIAEGYATAATVHRETGDKVFVAFDCGNLEAVARIVRKHHPKAPIVIMADNDRGTAGNPGITKARAAALAVGGRVAAPEFPEGVPGTDWNDWAAWRKEAHHGR